MQIIRPGMWPAIEGILTLFLVLIALVGIGLLILGYRKHKESKNILSKLIIACGGFALYFVIYNWIGYNIIYNKKAENIVGVFKCNLIGTTLTVFENNTWEIDTDEFINCKEGNWEFVMSEDWNYWNISSKNGKCWCQTADANQIIFDNYFGFIFEKE